MLEKKNSLSLFAAVFTVLIVGVMALFFSFYEPWLPAGPELIPDGTFSTTMATNSWTGWNQRAQLLPDGGFNDSPGVVLTAVSNKHGTLRFSVPDIRETDAFRVSLHATASGVRKGKKGWNMPRAVFCYYDKNNKGMFSIPHQIFSAGKDRSWKTHVAFFPVPSAAVNARLYLQNLGRFGTLRVDDISITPVRARSSAPWCKTFFGLLWFIAAALSTMALQLWKRRFGWLICATILLILIGVLLPGAVLDGALQQAYQKIHTLRATISPPEITAAPSGQPVLPKPSAPPEEKPPLFTGKEVFDHVHFVGHFILFSLLALLSALSWFSAKPSLRLALALFAGLTLFAGATEVLQFITSDRHASLIDLGIDLIGMAIVILLAFLIAGLRQMAPAIKNKPHSVS